MLKFLNKLLLFFNYKILVAVSSKKFKQFNFALKLQ